MEMLDTQDSRRDVVSIVGMGGLGKTTLAKKIYNSSFVKRSFHCRAWVDVSQDYNRKELLLKIAKSVCSPMEMVEADKLTEDGLVEKLRAGLEGNRYTIVLDDVWDKHLWDGIKAVFPDNGKRSRILLSSRLNEVASHASTRTHTYSLPLLNEDDSWKLFSRKVFHGDFCPSKLEELARQILTKCKGLPLAIIVVAGLLRSREKSMWDKVAAGLDWYLAQNPTECLGVLALSYDDLPPHLKPCFLYFGVYPEDFNIPARKLIRVWVAEGFVAEGTNNSLDMEDMAEEYLLQLIDRNLIQVASRRSDGGVKSCRVHDLLRDISIQKGKIEKFLVLDTKADGSSLASNKSIRRLSVHHGSGDIRYDYLSLPEFSRLRSIFSFGDEEHRKVALDKDPFSRLSKFCPYLRVLDLGSARCYNIPPKVEKLVQLRYLRMNALKLHEILPPISKLENLQTIDLEGLQFISTFSANLWEIKQLRHLILSRNYPTRFYIPKGNCSNLPNLRTLSNLVICKEADINMLKRLPRLEFFHIHSLDIKSWSMEGQGLQSLVYLSIDSCCELKSIPDQLKQITTFRQLKVTLCYDLEQSVKQIWVNDPRCLFR